MKPRSRKDLIMTVALAVATLIMFIALLLPVIRD